MSSAPIIPLRDVIRSIRADIRRRLVLENRAPTPWRVLPLLFHPGVVAVILFRISDYLHRRGMRLVPKLIGLFIFYYAKHEVHPGAAIGPGLVLPDIGGVGIPAFTTIGKNCTFMGRALLTVGGIEGIDLSKDRLHIGDDCVIGPGARILGAITLADGAQLMPNTVVITSFTKYGALISGIPGRRRRYVSPEAVAAWNPLRGCSMPPATR